MSKRRDKIVQELDPQTIDGFTEAQKQYYISLGFKPYLNAAGRIKWLRPDQHSLRIAAVNRRPFFKMIFDTRNIYARQRRKHTPTLVKILRHNWFFILIIAIIICIMLYILLHPTILI